jgi:hypothetical protein
VSRKSEYLEKIEFEFELIETELDIIDTLKKIEVNKELDDIQIRAAASSLHSIYNGIEKILIFKYQELDMVIPNDKKWHTNLLIEVMNKNIISEELEIKLREIMGFRHFYRHAYGFMLDIDLLSPLLNKIRKVVSRLKDEII